MGAKCCKCSNGAVFCSPTGTCGACMKEKNGKKKGTIADAVGQCAAGKSKGSHSGCKKAFPGSSFMALVAAQDPDEDEEGDEGGDEEDDEDAPAASGGGKAKCCECS